MRILLAYPPFTEIYGRYKPAAKIGAAYPPLGLMYLAAVLRKDHQVKILDMEAESLGIKEFRRNLLSFKPNVVGITSTTPLYHKVVELFKLVKSLDNKIITIAGGPHPTSLPVETLKGCPEIDFVVVGEGEITIQKLISRLEMDKNPRNLKGIAYRNKNKIVLNPKRPLIPNLDKLPFPARDLLKNEKYVWSVPGKGIVKITHFQTSRGCPFQCSFCSQHVLFGRKVRNRSINNIIKEIKEIVNKYGIKHLVLCDDTFGLDKKRTFDFCNKIREEKLNITWEGMTRVNIVTKELLRKMKEAGFVRISFGVESGNQDILNAVRKGITLKQIRKAYEIADSLGLETRMSVIFGLPFETKKTVRKTINFMKSLKAYQAYINIGTPFPATEYYEMAKKEYGGLKLLTTDWKEYRRWGNAVIEVNDLSREDLIKMQKRGLLEFYFRPKQIIYNLKRAGLRAAIKNSLGFAKSFFNPKRLDKTSVASNKMSVCMLTTAFPRYQGDSYLNFVLELSRFLVKKGVQIKVVTPNDSKTKGCQVMEGVKVKRFTYMIPKNLQKVAYGDGMIRNLNKSLMAKVEFPLFFLFLFLKSLKESKNYNILHAHTSLPGFAGVFIKKLTKKKLIITLHGTEIDMLKEGIMKKITLWILKNSDQIITVSNSLKQKVIKFGISKDKIETIPDGVDISKFKYISGRRNIDAVFIGRLSREKGVSFLIQATSKVTEALLSFKLLIVGEGDEKENLKNLVKNLELEKNVLFKGRVSYKRIPSILQKSKILVLPSLREGFGIVLLEAMALGAAAIGSNVGGILDIIQDKKTGLLFKKGDSKDLAENIVYLLKNPQIRQKLARNGRKTVEKKFTWEKVAEKTIEVYESIL